MERYRVLVVKARTGETFEGVVTDDGLQSLWSVTLDDGSVKYASVLDDVTRFRSLRAVGVGEGLAGY
jgi:hypothetical protein